MHQVQVRNVIISQSLSLALSSKKYTKLSSTSFWLVKQAIHELVYRTSCCNRQIMHMNALCIHPFRPPSDLCFQDASCRDYRCPTRRGDITDELSSQGPPMTFTATLTCCSVYLNHLVCPIGNPWQNERCYFQKEEWKMEKGFGVSTWPRIG